MKAMKTAKKPAAAPAPAMQTMKAVAEPSKIPAFVGALRLRRRVLLKEMKAIRNSTLDINKNKRNDGL